MNTPKYELTDTTKLAPSGVTLHRIRALRDVGSDVKEGNLGGWVATEKNLDQFGDAWVSGNAQVYGGARVFGEAWVYGTAWVYDNAQVYGNARVFDTARVSGDAQVYGDARVYGNARVFDTAHALDGGDGCQVKVGTVLDAGAPEPANAAVVKSLSFINYGGGGYELTDDPRDADDPHSDLLAFYRTIDGDWKFYLGGKTYTAWETVVRRFVPVRVTELKGGEQRC